MRERRDQRVHSTYSRPELVAQAPNDVWSWDITKLKTTLKWTYFTGIVPISHSQDTAGPMARDVTDPAVLLTAIAGSDPSDPATADANVHATNYTRFLDRNGLRGKRIGVVRELAGKDPNADRVLNAAIATMKAQGAIVVDPVALPHLQELGPSSAPCWRTTSCTISTRT